jgi:hypothetical protein
MLKDKTFRTWGGGKDVRKNGDGTVTVMGNINMHYHVNLNFDPRVINLTPEAINLIPDVIILNPNVKD